MTNQSQEWNKDKNPNQPQQGKDVRNNDASKNPQSGGMKGEPTDAKRNEQGSSQPRKAS